MTATRARRTSARFTQSGEITSGVCGHTRITSEACESTETSSDGMPPPVDTTCMPGCQRDEQTYPPPVALVDHAPAGCKAGFELNASKGVGVYTFDSLAPGGSAATALEVQFATYRVSDHIKIDGVTSAGTYPLIDTCTVQTAQYSDPTKGCGRPPDDSIRQYKVMLKAGTTQIKVDLSGVCSPIYLRVRGLCEFDVQPFFAGCAFRTLP